MTRINVMTMPINDTGYSCHTKAVELFCDMGSISQNIMPLVIDSLRGGHTHTYTHMHTDVCTETISRNQACISLRPLLTWFKKHLYTSAE